MINKTLFDLINNLLVWSGADLPTDDKGSEYWRPTAGKYFFGVVVPPDEEQPDWQDNKPVGTKNEEQ